MVPIVIRIQRYYYYYLGALFPRFSKYLFWKTFTTVSRRKFKPHHLQYLEKASRHDLVFKGFKIARYKFGHGEKRILIVHGQNGLAVDFRSAIDALVEKGFAVEAIDLPGHGHSSGNTNNMLLSSELVRHLHTQNKYYAILGHSLGASAAFYCFGHAKYTLPVLPKLVLMGMHDKTEDFFIEYKNLLQIPSSIYEYSVREIEKSMGFNLKEDMNAHHFIPLPGVDQVLIVHDEQDTIADLDGMKLLASNWSCAVLFTGDHGGHYHHYKHPILIEKLLHWL